MEEFLLGEELGGGALHMERDKELQEEEQQERTEGHE
jgi:hypothetical protein